MIVATFVALSVRYVEYEAEFEVRWAKPQVAFDYLPCHRTRQAFRPVVLELPNRSQPLGSGGHHVAHRAAYAKLVVDPSGFVSTVV